jgi:protein SSD1
MKEANKLIEEFMLLANMSVAKKIVVAFPEVALLRQHSPPKEKTILEFIQQANALGFSQFNEEEIEAGQLEKAFMQIEDPVKKSVLELLCVRPMQRATYFCSGEDKPAEFLKHYALNVEFYTHFTRYAGLFITVVLFDVSVM